MGMRKKGTSSDAVRANVPGGGNQRLKVEETLPLYPMKRRSDLPTTTAGKWSNYIIERVSSVAEVGST